MIVLITGTFDVYSRGIKTGKKEFVASHGIDLETGDNVIVQQEHPAKLGARWDQELHEWVID